jgi:hypothetical protein
LPAVQIAEWTRPLIRVELGLGARRRQQAFAPYHRAKIPGAPNETNRRSPVVAAVAPRSIVSQSSALAQLRPDYKPNLAWHGTALRLNAVSVPVAILITIFDISGKRNNQQRGNQQRGSCMDNYSKNSSNHKQRQQAKAVKRRQHKLSEHKQCQNYGAFDSFWP